MGMRERLIKILRVPIYPHELVDPTEAVADYLLDNDVVPVVRCKDCKHRYYNEDSEEYCCEVWGDGFDTFVNQDEFCSRGERKDNGKISL